MTRRAGPIVYEMLKAVTSLLSWLLGLYLSVNKVDQNLADAAPIEDREDM